MKDRLHGILSLVWLDLANLIALVVLWRVSPWLALIWAGLAFAAVWSVVRMFCTKCCCATECGHVVPGMLAETMGLRTPGSYSAIEILATLAMIMAVMLFPQYWIWPHRTWFAVYWALAAVSLVEILVFVCRRCGNRHCPNYPGNAARRGHEET